VQASTTPTTCAGCWRGASPSQRRSCWPAACASACSSGPRRRRRQRLPWQCCTNWCVTAHGCSRLAASHGCSRLAASQLASGRALGAPAQTPLHRRLRCAWPAAWAGINAQQWILLGRTQDALLLVQAHPDAAQLEAWVLEAYTLAADAYLAGTGRPRAIFNSAALTLMLLWHNCGNCPCIHARAQVCLCTSPLGVLIDWPTPQAPPEHSRRCRRRRRHEPAQPSQRPLPGRRL